MTELLLAAWAGGALTRLFLAGFRCGWGHPPEGWGEVYVSAYGWPADLLLWVWEGLR